MKTYPTTEANATDLRTLIGQPLSADYSLLAQDEELKEILAEDFEGYGEWSNDLEQFLFEAEQNEAKQVKTPEGPVYTSRDCTHAECKMGRCEKGLRIGGIEI